MSVHLLQVFRAGVEIAQFEINENTTFQKLLMGDHVIRCQVTLSAALPLQLGDYITYNAAEYTINTLPELVKDDVNYQYTIDFEAGVYTLYNKLFLNNGDSEFTYFGTLHMFGQLILDNINSIDSGWNTGTVDPTDEQYITFSSDTCRTALTKIAEAFKVEYDVDGKIITLKKSIGQNTNLTFKVGKMQGLYDLKRTSVNDKSVVTRVFGFGSSKNIDFNYRNGAKRLVFEARKLEKNVDLYKVKEGFYTNEDIYPHRDGYVTAFTSDVPTNEFTITDTSINFDLNPYIQEGTRAKIIFKSGDLSGYEFEITKYFNAEKKIRFIPFKDNNDFTLPSVNSHANIGDKYTLGDINMPQSYIDAAEAELMAATQDYLDENSVPQVMYDLNIDEKYIRDNNIIINAGDYIRVQDPALLIDGYLRVSSINWPLVNPSGVKATISNFILDSSQNRLKAAVLNNRDQIKQVYNGSILEARRQTSNLATLKETIFDPDGYFDPENIKPNSIETLYLSTGSKANDFNLSEVVIKANLNGNQNNIEVTGGRLLHNSIQIEGVGFIWVMTAISLTGLTTNTQYWLYAKCSKSALTGTFVISASKIGTNELAGYYHFTIGTLYPAKDGWRDFDFVKGMSYMVGDTLTTGKIKSIDAQTYWDLTQGKFKLGNGNAGLDWNVTSPDTLTIKGAIVQRPGGESYSIPLFRGAYVGSSPYYKGDTVSYNGSTWTYINDTPGSGNSPTEGFFWTESAKKGSDGTSIGIKGRVPTSANLPSSGNAVGDGYITEDTGHLWMWDGSAWSDLGLIRGEKGDKGDTGNTGSPGAPGANGQTPYLHIKYSNDGGISFTANGGETGGDWRGEYVDYNLADSSTPSDYTWVKVKGDQGIQGPIGANGQPTYTWIKYANDSDGTGISSSSIGKSYIGLAHNKVTATMSNTPSDYQWALFLGPQGIQGNTGPDGQPTYTWIKYADTAIGGGLSDDPAGKKYLAIAYNKNTQTESLVTTDYSYSLILGPQGKPAARTLYAKNDSPDTSPANNGTVNPAGWSETAPITDDNIYLGDNLSNLITDSAGNYIGVGLSYEYLWQINEKLDASGNFQSWAPANRVTGRPAPAADFTEVRFAKNGSPTAPPALNLNSSDPAGWSIQAPSFGPLEYIWKIYGDKFGDSKLLKGSWNGPFRETALDGTPGADGATGATGATGPSGSQGPVGPLPTGGDIYSSSKTYTGNSTRVDIVRYNDGTGEKAYVARVDAGSFSNVLPTNTAKWNSFGGQYESVATNLFFAQLAYIENLGVRNLATDVPGNKRIVVDGISNNITLLDGSNTKLVEIDDDAAIERVVIDSGTVPPSKIYTYGPGVRVGSSTGKSSNMSRNGFTVWDTAGDLKFKIGDHSNVIGGQDWRITATGVDNDPNSSTFNQEITQKAINGYFELRKADGGIIKLTFVDGLLFRMT